MIGDLLLQGARAFRSTLADPDDWLKEALGSTRTAAGVTLSEATAVRNPAVFACVNTVAETCSDLPCIVYERTGPRSRERADTDVWAPPLRVAANPEMTAREFWEAMFGYVELWGHAEAYIVRNTGRKLNELWPLPPSKTKQVRVTDGPKKGLLLGFNLSLDSGEVRFVEAKDALWVRRTPWSSKTPLQRHRETMAVGVAAEEFGARFFGQGASARGFVQMPPDATQKQAERTEAALRAKHEGLQRSHLMGVLEGGATWQDVGMPLRDAQYVEGQKFSIEQIARIFRVQPHKIGHLERSTFSNIEEQNIEWLTDSIGPRLGRMEAALRMQLMPAASRFGQVGDRWGEFLVDKLLRGDIEKRYKAYALGIQWGFLVRNEARERENLPDLEGLDDPLQPLNMAVVGEEPVENDELVRRLALTMLRNELPSANGDSLPDQVSG